MLALLSAEQFGLGQKAIALSSREPLLAHFRPLVGAVDLPTPEVSGGRRWWEGPLDVEGLAIDSIRTFLTLAGAVTGEARFGSDAALILGAFMSLDLLEIDEHSTTGFAPMSGFFETSDGWIRVHANYPHHARALERATNATDAAALRRAAKSRQARELEDRILAHDGVAAAVRTADEWRREESAREPWLTVDATHAAPCAPPTLGPLLSGLRVVDLTRVVAGPVASRALALLGADVIRVDPAEPAELMDHYVDAGFGKRSAVLDLGRDESRSRLRELLQSAHVLLTGYRPGSLDRFGLAPDSIAAEHPHLHHVRVQAWPQSSEWGARRGFDSIVQAATGISDLYRKADGTPGALPVQALDHATGYGAASAVLAAVIRHRESGVIGPMGLTLANTAAHLLASPAVDQTPDRPSPVTATMCTPAGTLRFAVPPILRNGVPVSYAHAPGPYGGSSLAWAPLTGNERS
ncbi:CoA transferase [Nocardioides bruguierae]|uniref:CoA transferase n=1 Tax=Nocardioides bruguierae TaxID=2945102 RepID=A0A9X2DB14_9ACTN|nr:CoA transferase [Nocardioides bruguierae]MCM0622617.1 CoA transferase [Nocardioides bruguierae]